MAGSSLVYQSPGGRAAVITSRALLLSHAPSLPAMRRLIPDDCYWRLEPATRCLIPIDDWYQRVELGISNRLADAPLSRLGRTAVLSPTGPLAVLPRARARVTAG